jgi:TatD DNase family protein
MADLFDTHCHIHEAGLLLAGDEDATRKLWAKLDDSGPEDILRDARQGGVPYMICVGCTLDDSRRAIAFAAKHRDVWASIGIHPHEAQHYAHSPKALAEFRALLDSGGTSAPSRIVAIGECGLDYYYEHSPKDDQLAILRFQIELALEHDLPLIFHVRDAFDDFLRVFDAHPGLRGVVHSFTATTKELEQALARGLYIGLNGIMTFTKHDSQLAAAKAVPLDKLVLETDAPFLTPNPLRGRINEPKYVRIVADFLAELRGEHPDTLAEQTTTNARRLFGIASNI